MSVQPTKTRKGARSRKERLRPPPLVPQRRPETLPLSHAQERLWFVDQLGLAGPAYNAPLALKLDGRLDVPALERSLSEVIRRHESLRTRFESVLGSPVQVIDPPGEFTLATLDLSQLHDDEKPIEVSRLIDEAVSRPFDLAQGPLIRASLFKLTPHEHILVLTLHHIVSDGWSVGILQAELGALYDAYCRGRPSPLPELHIQYADYAIWQRQWLQAGVLERQLQYWREHLLGAPPQLQLPTDRPRPPVESFKGATLRFDVPSPLTTALKELARRRGATLFMVCLAAYQLLLSRWSGQPDIVVGSATAGRTHQAVESLIGFFVNMIVLRTPVLGELTFHELLERVKDITLGAYACQDLPFEVLVQELQPGRNLARQPIFQVALSMENFPEEPFQLTGLRWSHMETARASAVFDLTLHLADTSGGLRGSLEYKMDLFEEETIERLAAHFRTVLEGIVANPDRPVRELDLMTPIERAQVLRGFNGTAVAYPQDRLVHQLFEEQAQKNPNALAVICEERRLTYGDLNRKANQLARALLAWGVRPEQRVCLYAERSEEIMVGLLGILKAGGAYVPLDVNYPLERLAYMVRDCAPVVLLTQEHLRANLPVSGVRVVALDTQTEEIRRQSDGDLDPVPPGVSPENLVYVIYTSGSTGAPKGAMVSHRNLVNLIRWQCDEFRLNDASRCSCVAALSFDAAAWEMWAPLSAGGVLVFASARVARDVDALLTWWGAQELDVSFLSTPLAELAFHRDIASRGLRTLQVAGDRLRHRPVAPAYSLVNNYGPTETTVCATSGAIRDEDTVLHIGRPIANTQTYILDSHLRPVPIGLAGEIYVGGAGVGRGYFNRPALTAERYVANPFNTESNGRMYKTGDLGRWRSDGTIEYVGRNDDQVKIRGYRIELGEIEAQLFRHEYVKDVIAVARENASGEKHLVAYVTLGARANGEAGPSVEDLRAHCRAALPDYMVPSAFVILHALPLTPNGKIDRQCLPAPGYEAYVTRHYEPPLGAVEETLATFWKGLLPLDRIGREDNFFELGAHSLHGVKLAAKVEEHFRVRLSVVAVFQYPTIREMAQLVESLRSAGAPKSSGDMEIEHGVI